MIKEIDIKKPNPEIEKDVAAIKPQADEMFAKLLAEGMDFLPAAYLTFDRCREAYFKQEGVETVCKEGCSDCCSQSFYLSKMEFSYLIAGFDQLGSKVRYQLKRRIDQHISVYKKKWKQASMPFLGKPMTRQMNKQLYLKLFAAMRGTQCPFLSNSTCIIYEYRPCECRTAFSLYEGHCKTQGSTKVSVTPFDFWLEDVIWDGQRDKNGEYEALLLAHRLKDYFK